MAGGGSTMRVELVSPERIVWSGDASMVVVRTLAGEVAFQPGHAPFLAALVHHHCRVYLADGTVRDAAVHRGFVEVSQAGGASKVTILSDDAELADEIDVEGARSAKDAAEARLRHEHDAEAIGELAKANARLRAARVL
jgi:F-type H+-transporting ATPase subunit epsilon